MPSITTDTYTTRTNYPDPDARLARIELENEMGMHNAGVVRFRRHLEKARARGQEDSTVYGDRIIGIYIERVADALEQWVEAGRGAAGAHRLAQPYIEALPYRVTAMLGLKALCERLMSGTAALGGTAIHIARMLEAELSCAALRAQDVVAYRGVLKQTREKGEYRRKFAVARFLARKNDVAWSSWPEKDCLHIGMAVINVIQNQVDLVEFYELPSARGGMAHMRPTRDTASAVNTIISKAVETCAPVLEPMVIPPKPWVAGELKGGYWTDYIKRRPMVKTRSRKYLEALKYADMPRVLEALNAVQATRWRINTRVLSFLQELMERDSELGGTPRATLREPPSKPEDIKHNADSRHAYRIKARAVHEDNVRIVSKRLSYKHNLQTAEKYRAFEAIYMPHSLDFRGRIYPMPALNPQGADYTKALLEFADGVPLGQHGLEWLKIHVANLYGVDKVSFIERAAWVDAHMDMLRAISINPHDNREWCDADSPFQAYAATLELVEAAERDNPESFVSHIPVALDGSCSGLQNLSMAFRDEHGGRHVNLLDADQPADIYADVAAKVKEWAERDAEDGNEAAKWWLEYGIDRKLTKRNCMTFPYGSKQRGFGNQIIEDHLRPLVRENDRTHPLLAQGESHRTQTRVPMMDLAAYIARLNYAAVQETVVKAAEAMEWMQQCARIVASEGRPVSWLTPLGMPVVQQYRRTKEARVETSLAGTRKVLSIRESTLKIDKRKSANAISPNVVHSLDASHLMLTVCNAKRAGLDAYALIHDSYGTHAGNTEQFYDVIRESMAELYSAPVFEDLRDCFASQLPPERREELPELPAKGALDPSSIRGALYAFA